MRRRGLPLAVCLSLLAQATGAADILPRVPVWLVPARAPASFQRPPDTLPSAPANVAPLGTETPALAPVPQQDDPAANRMLVTKTAGFRGVFLPEDYPLDELLRRLRASARGTRPVFADRFEQPWFQGPGFRVRLVYLKPVGVTWGDEKGYHGQVGAKPAVHMPAAVPQRWRRPFPLYFAGDRVEYEVEIENTGALPLPAMILRARQERFEPAGGPGRVLGPSIVMTVSGLPLGGRGAVRGAFTLSPAGRAALNFEQTHLVVSAGGGVGERVLLDVPQAGVADPPGADPPGFGIMALVRRVLWLLLLGSAAASTAWVLWLPDVRPLKRSAPKTTAFIERRRAQMEREGKPFRPVRIWVPLSRISENLQLAVITAEDDMFYRHDGIDWANVKSALEKDWKLKKPKYGASTITQQLAKNLYLSPSKNPLRKIKEMLIARRLEDELGKKRILELYLNVVEWGRGIYGAEAAAQAYFGKPAADLTLEEAVAMAVVLPSPRRHNPAKGGKYVERNMKRVIARMRASGLLDDDAGLTSL